MSDSTLKRFLTGTLMTGTGRFATVLFGFICMLIYARWIAAAEYGQFVVLQVMIGLLVGVADLGMGVSTVRFIARAENEAERNIQVNTALLFRFLAVVIIGALVFVFQNQLGILLGRSLSPGLVAFLSIFVIVEGVLAMYTSILEGLFRFRALGMIDFVTAALSLVLTIILVIFFGQGIMGLIVARLVTRLLGLAMAAMAAQIPLQFRFKAESLKTNLKFGLPLYLNNLLSILYSRADTIIIGLFLGPAQVAFFEYARKIPESLNMMYEAFRQVYLPFQSKFHAAGDYQKFAELLNTSNRLAAFGGGLVSLGGFAFGTALFTLLFSNRYLPSVPAFQVLLVALIFTVIDSNLGYSLVAIGQSGKPVMFNILRTAVTFVCYALLIPSTGIVGAAAAGLIGTAVVNPLNLLFLKRGQINVKLSVYLIPLLLLGEIWVIGTIGGGGQIFWLAGSIVYLVSGLAFQMLTVSELKLVLSATTFLVGGKWRRT